MTTNLISVDRYKIRGKPEWGTGRAIGSGGFGDVFRERVTRPGRFTSEVCAVKVIPKRVKFERERYMRELVIMARVVQVILTKTWSTPGFFSDFASMSGLFNSLDGMKTRGVFISPWSIWHSVI